MRIIRRAEVRSRSGYSDMHIYRLEKVGKFPKRIQIGPNAVGMQCDVRDKSQVEQCVASVLALNQRIDILVSNAASGGFRPKAPLFSRNCATPTKPPRLAIPVTPL